ncbi:RimJ/RimL family protein N-acetyltransferase [Altererythrobacter atlanticus]|uniref:Acetyltransferase (GNAT) family protein n=1 Tax=Croceibacterium atlanticum TaxID=1267766 RepID=A0A0F7KW33_9SPHN|nr:GNAT family N-acetyltransferase [Croceibacterium atlanticum]AKH43397.1 Acetyltransferase (GNAT) family protein [Croceibacterium atlanticum]MBB5731896.1 RimJ/RimL family protein N-acetyltransferase [Croceibacterium atlanticum]
MQLQTERLELRLPVADDIAAMHAIVSHEQTSRFLGRASDPALHFERMARNAGSWLLYGYGSFMVRLRGREELIGNCGIFHSWRGVGDDFDDNPEAGWILGHEYGGMGYAGEAMRAVFEWFEQTHGPHRVVCMIAPENRPSLRLAEKLGFTPMREGALPDGEAVILLDRAAGSANRPPEQV